MSYLSKYPTAESLMAAYSPDRQALFSQFPERCVTGDSPTLSEMARLYGANEAEAWVEIQVRDISEFSGAKEKLRIPQITETARVVCASYYFMKLSEVMLFFFQLKGGTYGKFYGAVDPMTITQALRSFAKYRAALLDRHEQAERQRTQEESRQGCCTREEYDRMESVEIPVRIIRDSPQLRQHLRPYDVGVNGKATLRIPKDRMKVVLWYEDRKQIRILH